MSLNIHVSTLPPHLRITQTMIEDFILDPVLGVKWIFNEELDAFQRVRLKICWWTPRVYDSSGFSSTKTRNLWWVSNLRQLLFSEHIGGVYYPVFMTGQLTYWKFYNEVAAKAPIFRAQVGRNRLVGVDAKANEDAKALGKGPSCWTCDFKNGSQILMPAPGFLQDAKTQAGLRFNDLFIDEIHKIEATGSEGIDAQLIGRTTRHCANKWHPILRNHHLFQATAEDTQHPSYERYESFLKEVKAGNPDYAVINFSYKDYSDLPFKNGQTFKDVFREELVLKDMKKNKTRAGFLQEGLGIWSRNGRGLYTGEIIASARAHGQRDRLDIYCSRREDPEGERAHYFLGIDPAKGDNLKNDDGALVSLRVVPLVKENEALSDLRLFKAGFNWAYKVRRADAPQWATIIHQKHLHFGFTGMMMDPGGGGIWIRPELAKSKQKIRGIEQTVRPIACIEDEQGLMVSADFILTMFKPRDARVELTWANMGMKHQDNLTDIAHTEFIEGLTHVCGFPLPPKKRSREEVASWRDEKLRAAELVELIAQQLGKIFVLTNEDGSTFFSRYNARSFASKGRKDFAYAALFAWMRFLIWLRGGANDLSLSEADAALCGGD